MYNLSKYNYFVDHSDRIIYFNGLSGKVFSVSKKEHDFLKKQMNDPIAFEILYPTIFNKFKEWGFIKMKNKDEIESIRFRNRDAVFLDRMYRVFINPTLECNFNCWYCYEEHPKGFMTEETMERIKKHIYNMVIEKKITGVQLDWFGGEPLLYFNEVIYPLATYVKNLMLQNNLLYRSHATTNGSLITREMVDKFKEINLNNFQITIDGDAERHNKIRNENGTPSFKTIVDNITSICESNPEAFVTLRINYDEKTLTKSNMEKVFRDFKPEIRKQISPSFHRVWQTNKFSYKSDNKDRIRLHRLSKELGFRPNNLSHAFSINKGITCYVDRYYHTEFNYDGKAYKCTARSYSDKYVVGELDVNGNLIYNEDKISKMFSKACFENEMCIECKHLAICNGPCSQKIIETPTEKIEQICSLKGEEIGVNAFIVDYYESKDKVLAEFE